MARLLVSSEVDTSRRLQVWGFRMALILVTVGLVLLQLTETPLSQGMIPRETQSTVHFTTVVAAEPKGVDFDLAPFSPLHAKQSNHSCPSTSLVNQGAVFVYFHLAKAGGTTIRFLFKDPPVSAEVMVRTSPDKADLQVRKWLADPTEKRNLFVELHDMGNPSVERLKGQLQDWRKMASLHKRPLFIFTVVREPISYALSYFTYQNVGQGNMPRYHHWDGSGRRANLTHKDLLDYTLPSPQCLFYSRGEAATTADYRYYGSKWNATKECPEVYDSMTQYMDWIGTVETMQKQMLPLLTYLSSNDPNIGRTYHKKNPSSIKVREFTRSAKANETTIAALKPKLAADRWLYDRIQEDFQWDSFWASCIPEGNSTSTAGTR